jgi:hypothetical protein
VYVVYMGVVGVVGVHRVNGCVFSVNGSVCVV